MLMPELISIEEAARITGFPYEEIEDWVKSRKITSFHTRTGTRMVDPENLRDFIAHIEHLGIQKLYLQLVIQDMQKQSRRRKPTRLSPSTTITFSAYDP